jgi:hypothetical protein
MIYSFESKSGIEIIDLSQVQHIGIKEQSIFKSPRYFIVWTMKDGTKIRSPFDTYVLAYLEVSSVSKKMG